jgi:ribosomal-protein-alanine N-acetyltransferase
MDEMTLTDIETIPTGLRVAAMTPEILPGVVTLEEECGLNSRGIEGYRRMLSNPGAILLAVIEKDDRVIGVFSGSVVVDELQIDDLAISLLYRRRGIGRKLLNSAFSLAKSLGAHTAILEVRSANSPAREFYEKEGFKFVGLRSRYYTSPPDDALLFSREI